MIDPLVIPILINKMGKKINTLDKTMLKELGISKLHVLYLLALLNKEEGLTLKELSDYLGFDKANTTRAIKRLLEIEYVEKKPQENLKLKYKVVLTNNGRDVAKRVISSEVLKNRELFSLFTNEEMVVMQSVIEKLLSFLDS